MNHSIIRVFFLLSLLCSVAFVQAAEPHQFKLTDLNGKTHTAKDYTGKWLFINYWATWCPPCLREIPDLVYFHEKYKGTDAVVLGVNFENIDDKQLRQFVHEHFMSYPVVSAKPDMNGPFGSIPSLPTTFLISPKGELVASKAGMITLKNLEDTLDYYKQQLVLTSKDKR